MNTGQGQVIEVILKDGFRAAKISCPTVLIPKPGQYLLAGAASRSDLLPVSLYSTESTLQSVAMAPWSHFTTSTPIPETWTPGLELFLRGPLGKGFTLPASARKVVLVAFEESISYLVGLIAPALKQGAAVVVVSASREDGLPDEVEVQPLSALVDVVQWGDYVAMDVLRENLPGVKERLVGQRQTSVMKEAQVLIRTQMPCGGVAECGVCALATKSAWKMVCKDGPVFVWGEF